MSSIFQLIRKWVINHGANTPAEVVRGWVWLIPAIVIYFGVCVLAVWLFNRDAPRIAEEL
jgi:ABC-2 type transport system permease protein